MVGSVNRPRNVQTVKPILVVTSSAMLVTPAPGSAAETQKPVTIHSTATTIPLVRLPDSMAIILRPSTLAS